LPFITFFFGQQNVFPDVNPKSFTLNNLLPAPHLWKQIHSILISASFSSQFLVMHLQFDMLYWVVLKFFYRFLKNPFFIFFRANLAPFTDLLSPHYTSKSNKFVYLFYIYYFTFLFFSLYTKIYFFNDHIVIIAVSF